MGKNDWMSGKESVEPTRTRKYDFFISYSHRDCLAAERVIEKIKAGGYTLWYDGLSLGDSWVDVAQVSVRSANCFIVLITEDSVRSEGVAHEMAIALEDAKKYDKRIFAIVDQRLIEHFSTGAFGRVTEENAGKSSYLSNLQIIQDVLQHRGYLLCDYASQESVDKAIGTVLEQYGRSNRRALLNEQLVEYLKIDDSLKFIQTLKKYVFEILPYTKEGSKKDRIQFAVEIESLLDKLNVAFTRLCDVVDYQEERVVAHESIDLLNKLKEWGYESIQKIFGDTVSPSVLETSIAITIFYDLFFIKRKTVSVLTNGDVVCEPGNEEEALLRRLIDLYESADRKSYDRFSPNEKKIIEKIPRVIKTLAGRNTSEDAFYKARELTQIKVPDTCPSINKEAFDTRAEQDVQEKKSIREEGSIDPGKTKNRFPELKKIAEYINASNKLFEEITDENISFEFMSCLKTSYERLKNYSLIAGCKSIASECVNKITLINQKLEKLETRTDKNSEIKESSFKALLGLKAKNADAYDVFLSYKHEDEDLATNVYKYVKSYLLEVFFDKVTLPILGKSEYHEAIMEALDKANNFVVVLSDLEYLHTHWVKLEMDTFNHEMREGRKESANFIMIVTPDIFRQIIETNKRCLPIAFRSCEIMRTTDYRDRLASYLRPAEE